MEAKKPEGPRGSGELRVYHVEARTTYPGPETVGDFILTGEWRKVPFGSAPIGVPLPDFFDANARMCGYVDYKAAVALAAWFRATAGYCCQTRLVASKFTYSYSAEEVGVGPFASALDDERAFKPEPREAAARSSSTERE